MSGDVGIIRADGTRCPFLLKTDPKECLPEEVTLAHVNGRVFHAIFEMGQIYMIGYYRPVVERSREMDRLKQ